ncbi:uncharacterized protein LOC111872145 isoform X2 [Cryptotermes secundus]|uniref:uncharacterized protein LOC111872145 isoform X2 n=1 Tax=Cryptotermes secundus TaxID=105785 RepID=UPI001454D35F|nr:uncharacterized protein LOC111872145 isoform X2 [Cryptotermes secundus]
MLKWRLLLSIPFTLLVFHTTCRSYDGVNDMPTLSRRKRYIVFPEGSTFSIAFCTTWKTLTDDLDIYTIGLNWAISYELPNQTIRDPETHRIVPPFHLRRRRGELYQRLEAAMDALPLEKVDVYEPREHHDYDAAHRRGLLNRDCLQLYPECTVSLIDMVLGT